ncbi:MAG: ParB/RepB/Spo0J family partition protein [Planctomycetia bacterium]|nr:ParB/RepB/Spo0J family partition protein [Planctomycetia bacterium]
MNKERRLGRGLEALLGRAGVERTPVAVGAAATPAPPPGLGAAATRLFLHSPEEIEEAAAAAPAHDVATALVDPNPWQPRTTIDDVALAELADSLREHGLVQPIVIRARGDRYQLIAGQRRLAAARRLGWERLPSRLLEVDDRQMAEIAIVENLQRRDLDALEKAASFRTYLASWKCTQEELAKRLAIDRSTVANLIRLLDLPEAVQQRLRAGEISMGHARALLPLGDESQQARLADRIAAEGLSVRVVEGEVQEFLRQEEQEDVDGHVGTRPGDGTDDVLRESSSPTPTPGQQRRPGRPATRRPAQVAAVEQQLRRALGVKVVVHANGKGAGRIVVPFADHAEFQRLLDQLAR